MPSSPAPHPPSGVDEIPVGLLSPDFPLAQCSHYFYYSLPAVSLVPGLSGQKAPPHGAAPSRGPGTCQALAVQINTGAPLQSTGEAEPRAAMECTCLPQGAEAGLQTVTAASCKEVD